MTRIVAGTARSLSLTVPKSGTRPTSERVREALFSALDAAGAVEDARVLDLYAGSGALGLEALSRGARSVVLVERAPAAVAACRTNAAAVNRLLGAQRARIVAAPVASYLGSAEQADLVLIDPPYDVGEEQLAEELRGVAAVLSADGVVVVERSRRSPEPSWPEGLELVRERRYGETTVWWAERPLPGAES
ncbi:16S rRNA (guanine(966)-N(2))-methyltransferase RsmD [Mycetocola reblochoni]|uniref:16S rRNA (Guanine(966)-N(2))-methyltransferaseG966 n=2 Tax=Mycetocola reblochoni TaxID=331618 RepID=A0A1R4JAU6_9MICO|nr:16S rRNA (guanine(966)-N(2))-methyltransferase RsmD [Mycetocola reblochoni]RLP70017.1 16S rRNA (guanine(966)-N(2))-methyltransferase RsmD [Mycetocola reblochoni]SJN29261.1 16S rRNA (guanine(966)-N(2))-methyltransferaseG966 [Mycetocola reblochoni REB411]